MSHHCGQASITSGEVNVIYRQSLYHVAKSMLHTGQAKLSHLAKSVSSSGQAKLSDGVKSVLDTGKVNVICLSPCYILVKPNCHMW